MQLEQLDLFEEYFKRKLLLDLYVAYYDARRNKRNTLNALTFEMNFERNLFELFEEITERRYAIKPGICFINFSPVQREIFAADFRDRVVHHLLFNYISPVFEKTFINDSYSCRKNRGTHYGIKRVDHFIRSCSNNYQSDCYILKLDIRGYFMSISRNQLYEKISSILSIRGGFNEPELSLLIYLLQKIIFNDPTKNCIVKGNQSDWKGLPPSKSLFHASQNCGLPIGNLTSQLFGNIYLNEFDHYIKKELGIKYYGRYVDDMILIHPDKGYLRHLIPEIRDYLKNILKLDLHMSKIYLQHFTKGVKFLGTVVKPYRIYIANRTKNNLYSFTKNHCENFKMCKLYLEHAEINQLLSGLNSYLGIMKHYNTYNLRYKAVKKFDKLPLNAIMKHSDRYEKMMSIKNY